MRLLGTHKYPKLKLGIFGNPKNPETKLWLLIIPKNPKLKLKIIKNPKLKLWSPVKIKNPKPKIGLPRKPKKPKIETNIHQQKYTKNTNHTIKLNSKNIKYKIPIKIQKNKIPSAYPSSLQNKDNKTNLGPTPNKLQTFHYTYTLQTLYNKHNNQNTYKQILYGTTLSKEYKKINLKHTQRSLKIKSIPHINHKITPRKKIKQNTSTKL